MGLEELIRPLTPPPRPWTGRRKSGRACGLKIAKRVGMAMTMPDWSRDPVI